MTIELRFGLGLVSLVLVQAFASACSGSSDEASGDSDSGAENDSSAATGTGGTSGSTDSSSSSTGSGGASGATGETSSASGTDGGVLDPVELCGGTCQCANGIDDDGDGKVDGFDEECTGATDNDEGSFATGISGDNKDPKWQDCFFDGNSGAGDDGCRYHTDCLTGDLPDDDPSCTVTQACVDFCVQRTPSGCDCFGCCTFDTTDGPLSVQIGLTCDYDDIEDAESCPRCTPSTQCNNECGECELCPGKDSLPETCEEEVPQCDDGRQACDEQNPCPQNYWCQLGCCVLVPIQ